MYNVAYVWCSLQWNNRTCTGAHAQREFDDPYPSLYTVWITMGLLSISMVNLMRDRHGMPFKNLCDGSCPNCRCGWWGSSANCFSGSLGLACMILNQVTMIASYHLLQTLNGLCQGSRSIDHGQALEHQQGLSSTVISAYGSGRHVKKLRERV